ERCFMGRWRECLKPLANDKLGDGGLTGPRGRAGQCNFLRAINLPARKSLETAVDIPKIPSVILSPYVLSTLYL
ncbi:MAG: hypothetical protein EBT62_04435, partial [Opitutaceae bacterium]|nr:hypothetical protein [Opitutaceae bacterium]